MIPVFLDSARKHKNLARTYKNWLPDVPAAFDVDTIDTIGIDNQCSKCISNVRSDFVGKLIKEVKTIHGYHGAETKMIYRGLLQ
jgi:hypothetical protein